MPWSRVEDGGKWYISAALAHQALTLPHQSLLCVIRQNGHGTVSCCASFEDVEAGCELVSTVWAVDSGAGFASVASCADEEVPFSTSSRMALRMNPRENRNSELS